VPRICARLLGSLLCCCPSGEKELQWSVGALSPPAAHSWLATAWLPTHRSVGSSLALLPRLARRLRSSYYMQIYGVLSSQRCHWIIEREGERETMGNLACFSESSPSPSPPLSYHMIAITVALLQPPQSHRLARLLRFIPCPGR
jgi:hypothetical protein